MKPLNIQFVVGLFVIAGVLCFAYLAIKMGDVGLFDDETYVVNARFSSISGLKEGAFIEIAGVRVGKVSKITIDPEEYEAVVDLELDKTIQIQDDAIASIRTQGIIGDKFVKITPGGSPDFIEAGMEIIETESAISLEELVSKYIFEGGNTPEAE